MSVCIARVGSWAAASHTGSFPPNPGRHSWSSSASQRSCGQRGLLPGGKTGPEWCGHQPPAPRLTLGIRTRPSLLLRAPSLCLALPRGCLPQAHPKDSVLPQRQA